MNKFAIAGLGAGAMAGGVFTLQMVPATSAFRRARARLAPGLSGIGHPGHVALTFDDGPDPKSTPAFLDVLDTLGWKATFFMLGNNAEQYPELTAEVASRGHEVAVHGYSHTNQLWRGPLWAHSSFKVARDILVDLTGAQPVWARPPYGALSTSSLIGARSAGLRTVLWTTWGRDWREKATPETIVADVTATMASGPTVLLHDSDCTSAEGSWKATLASLPILYDRWASAGLQVGPLREHGLA